MRFWQSLSLRQPQADPFDRDELLFPSQKEREPGSRERLHLLCRKRHAPDPLRQVYHSYRPNFLHARDHVHLGYGLTSTRRIHYLSHGDAFEFEVPDARGGA